MTIKERVLWPLMVLLAIWAVILWAGERWWLVFWSSVWPRRRGRR